MNDKNKAIEEMAKVICQECIAATKEKNCQNEVKDCMAYEYAKLFYNAGYRKVNDDEVVISKEEYNGKKITIEMFAGRKTTLPVGNFYEMCGMVEEQTRKETAEEILQTIKSYDGWNELQRLREDIAETYGVEVK